MKIEDLQKMIENQRMYFEGGKTLSTMSRIEALKSLKRVIEENEEEIYKALKEDLGKSEPESYMCEVGLVKSEITYMLKHLKSFAKPKTVRTPFAQFHSHSYRLPCPRGVVLIMSPWNYPFMLALDPLVDALAAGNTAVIKPSAYAPKTSAILCDIVEKAFDKGLVCVVTGGREENKQLLLQKFDYIFFTGSSTVGKEVLKSAAPNLTPVSLELGGKSPCIVDESANLKLSARRIVFGKFLNCGQTCVAPDYICVHKSVAEQLLKEIKREITKQFGEEPLNNDNYGKIINKRHFERISGLMNAGNIYLGGKVDTDSLRIEPTVLYPCSWEEPVMQEEIFGPLLPIITYTNIDDLLKTINSRPNPLAFYTFSKNKNTIKRINKTCPFGGGCINDTIIHLATSEMGFGGVGNSGMGAYHGKIGFDTFSHYKSIVDKKTWLDLPMRYQPYTKLFSKIVKFFLH